MVRYLWIIILSNRLPCLYKILPTTLDLKQWFLLTDCGNMMKIEGYLILVLVYILFCIVLTTHKLQILLRTFL